MALRAMLQVAFVYLRHTLVSLSPRLSGVGVRGFSKDFCSQSDHSLLCESSASSHRPYTVSIKTVAVKLAAKERRDRKVLFLFVFFAFFRGYSFILPALTSVRRREVFRRCTKGNPAKIGDCPPIAAPNDNDIEMDRESVKKVSVNSLTNRLYHQQKRFCVNTQDPFTLIYYASRRLFSRFSIELANHETRTPPLPRARFERRFLRCRVFLDDEESGGLHFTIPRKPKNYSF
jgi:hypothetical protein